jgi:hypothetical protein
VLGKAQQQMSRPGHPEAPASRAVAAQLVRRFHYGIVFDLSRWARV